MMMMLTMQTSWCETWCCCCWPARPDDDDVEDIAFWPAGPNCSGERLLERPGRHWGWHDVHPQVLLVSCHTVVEIKQTRLYWKSSDNSLKCETFQSSVIVQFKSEFQIFPATTGNFSANGHLVRKSDVDDDDVWTKTIMLMMLMIMLIRSCRSYWWWCFFITSIKERKWLCR